MSIGDTSVSSTNAYGHSGQTDSSSSGASDSSAPAMEQLAAGQTATDRLVAQDDDGAVSDLGLVGAAALGTQLPLPANRITGTGAVQADIAARMLENVVDGRPPFRPELGQVGGVSWFVTDGNPHTGVNPSAITLPVEVEIPRGATALEFREQDLLGLLEQALPDARRLAESQFRGDNGLGADDFLNSRARNTIERNAARMAERAMWTNVGEQVASSRSGIGQVFLEGSRFSKQGDGVFTLTSRASNVRIQGGTAALLDVITSRAVPAEAQVVEAAEQLVRQGKIAGRLEGVFRVGGRVLIVAGIAADAYNIYTADDRVRETLKTVGGWGGAAAGMAIYNSATGPSNALGPWAWLANGVGNVVSAGAGYWVGSTTVELVYDLVIDGNAVHVPAEP